MSIKSGLARLNQLVLDAPEIPQHIEVPPPTDIERLREYIKSRRYGEARMFTPDINKLEHHQRKLIFVCDHFGPGGQYHDYITETNLFGRYPACAGYTEDSFTFFRRNLGNESYPIALPSSFAREFPSWRENSHGVWQRVPATRIWGQVYSIRPYQFKKIDFLRENGVPFIRKSVSIIIPYQKAFRKPLPEVSHEMKGWLDCQMYVGNPEYWGPLLDGGFEFEPVRTIKYSGVRVRDWLDEYYFYSNVKRE